MTNKHKALFSAYRVEKFWVNVLDENDVFLERLDGVEGGSITCSTDARIKRAGKLSVVSDKPTNWWGRKRLQPWVEVNGFSWSLGVFIPTSPQQDHNSTGVSYEIDIHDKLVLLDEHAIPRTLTIPAGTTLVDWVIKTIKEATGEKRVNISRKLIDGRYAHPTNARPLVWDAGESMLTIINDVLDFMGFFSLSVDTSGQFTSEPYVVPAERPVSWQFWEGMDSIYAPEFTHTQDLAGIPNRIVYTTQSTGVGEGEELNEDFMISTWENHDPNSPYSYENRGRWITEVKTDAEAVDQQELDKMVKTRAENALEPMVKVEIETALLPIELNQIVDFKGDNYGLYASVRRFEFDLEPAGLMAVVLRKVNREYK